MNFANVSDCLKLQLRPLSTQNFRKMSEIVKQTFGHKLVLRFSDGEIKLGVTHLAYQPSTPLLCALLSGSCNRCVCPSGLALTLGSSASGSGPPAWEYGSGDGETSAGVEVVLGYWYGYLGAQRRSRYHIHGLSGTPQVVVDCRCSFPLGRPVHGSL